MAATAGHPGPASSERASAAAFVCVAGSESAHIRAARAAARSGAVCDEARRTGARRESGGMFGSATICEPGPPPRTR